MTGILSIRNVKAARKPHTCDTCMRKIQQGEPYTAQAQVGEDGEFEAWTFCSQCIAAWAWLWRQPDTDAWDTWDLLAYVKDWADDPEARRIRVGIETQWRAERAAAPSPGEGSNAG